jgi:uncharacterized protein (TIGR01777 family)
MTVTRYAKQVDLPTDAHTAFAWHERPGAFERLAPPWQRITVAERTGSIRSGDRLVMRLRVGPFSRRWVAVHEDYEAGRQFVDRQERGPFAAWRHAHRFADLGATARLEDEIEYRLPLGAAGRLAAGALTTRQLERLFAFRHRRLVHDLERHRMTQQTLRVAITGSTGLIGSALSAFLTTGGHEVVRVQRGSTEGLEGADAVVHLAGESIGKRWTEARKQEIRRSRDEGTRTLASAVAALERPPAVFVSASAVGIYGSQEDEILTEDSTHGTDFLAEVCERWEAATAPAADAGIRVANLRFGVVLEALLPQLLTPFRLGLGGRIGSGRQWFSWVALDDLIAAVQFAILDGRLRGAVNVTSPEPVTNAAFTKTLGKVLGRPTIFPLPAPIVSLLFGEMGRTMLLGSQRVLPERLHSAGFEFGYARLEDALRHVLGKTEPT